MSKIKMTNHKYTTVKTAFDRFLIAVSARGVKDKTLCTYRSHFKAISKRLDVEIPIEKLNKSDLEIMINNMNNDGLSSQSINSYTRTLKVFFSWCNDEGFTNLNIPLYKTQETVKDVYTDEELLLLLKKPKANCSFCEYRNWAIVNFLMNSGCRASTIRNIQIQDVDLIHSIVSLRHTKNRKVQIIPLCQSMLVILKEYMAIRGGETTDYLFCTEYGKQLSESGLRQAIELYNTNRGVKKTSIHQFRHTFAKKYLIDCGGNAFTLQRLLGHSTLNMTRHYCNIYNADIVKNYDRFSPLAQINSLNKKTITKNK